MNKSTLVLYFLSALGLLFYSYGFVDFNLTLSPHPWVNQFVGWSQQLAMFNRPASTQVYLGLFAILLSLYCLVLRRHPSRFPWLFVSVIATIFALAYPFLSSDVFKYLFSAKTVLLYHANPHQVAPQVFADDLWLRFMRWIHTPSPYGPVQTGLAIPYYLVALGKFTPMLYLYKLDQLFWYGLTIWVIGKLARERAVPAQLYFALNPLVLIEWLVNAHNDAPMISLALLALYLARQGRGVLAWLSLLLSIGIKYVTVIFLPLILFPRKFSSSITSHYLLLVLTLVPLFYHYSYQYQPWYVTWIIPFAALSHSRWIRATAIAYSTGALLRYVPFIQIGLWEGSARYFAVLTFTPAVLTGIYFALLSFVRRPHNQL